MGALDASWFNLPGGHAYSLMGVHELVNSNKTV
jgi:hypothetical protein